jgi:L-threonylcarbamoyladenylate synthase
MGSFAQRLPLDCKRAAELLSSGRLVAFPTETVYGLGADATNPDAVAGIFEAKQRPFFDPLIVHVADLSQLQQIVSSIPAAALTLAHEAWPGPLTVVLPKTSLIPDLVTAGLPGVGVRIPRHPLALKLITAAGCPVAAPSANPFGSISPTTAEHVLQGLGDRIDGVLDGGPCEVGVESTVVSFMEERPTVLRPGGMPIEDIERLIGPVRRADRSESPEGKAQQAPGMLSRHYAPRTRLLLIRPEQTAVAMEGNRCVLMTYGSDNLSGAFEHIENLSTSGDLRTCAVRFFAALRSLDSLNPDVIIARSFPESGLGIALNDRLRRASA